MIVSRTPFRISFFGGGTDYPAWFREHGGTVLACTINRYCYIMARLLPPFFDHKTQVIWSKIERVKSHREIDHPVVRAVLDFLNLDYGVSIHHEADLPSRTGLGSSSAFTVGVLNALYALIGRRISKSELAQQAIYVEQELLKENVGVQDQIQTAFGGLNRIEILSNGVFKVEPLVLSDERLAMLHDRLLLFYTGISRTASDVAKEQVAAIPKKVAELLAMQRMVDEAIDILALGTDLDHFGRLLHESWMLKRTLSDKVAPAFVDEIYEHARAHGALGGKLLGAGGGGFMLLYVRPENHARILEALRDLLVVPIEIENSGTQVIFYDPDRYSRTVLSGQRFRYYGTDELSNGAGRVDFRSKAAGR